MTRIPLTAVSRTARLRFSCVPVIFIVTIVFSKGSISKSFPYVMGPAGSEVRIAPVLTRAI